MNLPELQTYIQVNNISKNQLEEAYLNAISGDFSMETNSVIWVVSETILWIIWKEEISWTQMRNDLLSVPENYEAMKELSRVFCRLEIPQDYLDLFHQHKDWKLWSDLLIKIGYEYENIHFYLCKNHPFKKEEIYTITNLLERLGWELISIEPSYSNKEFKELLNENNNISYQEKQDIMTFLEAKDDHKIDIYLGEKWAVTLSNTHVDFQEDFASFFQKEESNITSIILI